MVRRLIAASVAVLAFGVLAVPLAQGDTQDVMEPQHNPPTPRDGFQALTCKSDLAWPDQCSPDEKEKENWFTQAGGHPPIAVTQYYVKSEVVNPPGIENALEKNLAIPKTIRVDLPPGLTVNPQATEQCSIAAFKADACPPGAQVGLEEVTLSFKGSSGPPPQHAVIQPNPGPPFFTKVPLWNLEPEFGEPARFGFKIGSAKTEVFLEGDVAWESDYHAGFTIVLPPPNPAAQTIKSRLVNEGRKGDGTYITLPTTCFDPGQSAFEHLYSAWLRADSVELPDPAFPNNSTPLEAKLPPGVQPTGCENVPFDPGIDVNPGTNQVDSPAPATVTATLPFNPGTEGGEGISQSHVKSARVTMPRGMGINPSGANGLEACTDEQFRKGVRVTDNACPAASDIGTVEIETPPLPEGSLKGDVYVGEQKSRDPRSGDVYRILAEAKSVRHDVVVRLVGNVVADPETGQLTAVLDEQLSGPFAGALPRGLPQVPFEFVKVKFDGGKEVLSSPPTCANSETVAPMEPWARPGTFATPSSKFTLTSIPTGGTCPTTMAERPFTPVYKAKAKRKKAGKYSPFKVRIARSDGEQELKVANVTLPTGLTGKLRGVKYCSKKAIALAAQISGKDEQRTDSCPKKSQIGKVVTRAGTGNNPIEISGKAYLAGRYGGADVSMVTITPAVAGPFDLGNVVVRVPLHIKPRTAQVKAMSDTIPDVFGGAKLDIRSIVVNVNRKRFMLNPTGCGKKKVSAVLMGGGADPTNRATFSSYEKRVPFRAKGCKRLDFEPELSMRLLGGPDTTTRAKHPGLRAVLVARKGDANVKRAAVVLPDALILDQSNIRKVCTRPELASHDCPKSAIYGYARARTPLLGKPLKGPVYMTPSKNVLPDLVADLRGQVDVRLYGVISSVRGGIKTVFNSPDVPVRKFVLTMKGGPDRGLLFNSRNLCEGPLSAFMDLKAQNGKHQTENALPLEVGACDKLGGS